MAQKFTGIHGLADLVDTRFQQVTVAQFGYDNLIKVVNDDLAAHNKIVDDLTSTYCARTTDILRVSGASIGGEMAEVDEFGVAPTQKSLPGQTVGFPLRSFQFAVGWTRRYFLKAKVYDLAVRGTAAQKAHLRQIARSIKKAIYGATNYTFVDHLVNNVSIPVKAFYNADGTNIPDGPNGEVFNGASHTHYIASATLTTTAMNTLINTIIEHGNGGKIQVAFNIADQATISGLTGFTPAADPRLILATTTTTTRERLDITRLDNRMIGYYGAAEIWLKPWAVANYAAALDVGSSDNKPLAFREDQGGAPTGLYVAAEFEDYPLYSEVMQCEFGVGVWNRANGAVLQFNNASFTSPTIP